MFYHVKTEIHINRPPEIVWNALTDFSKYSQWNPFITSINKLSEDKLEAIMKNNGSEMTFKPRILKWDPNKELRWLGKLGEIGGLFTGEHYFVLTESPKGTLFSHGEIFSGVLAWILLPFMHKKIEGNFIAMNNALKSLLEEA